MTFFHEEKAVSDKMHALSDEMRELEAFFRVLAVLQNAL